MPHTSSHLLKLMFRVNWTFYKQFQSGKIDYEDCICQFCPGAKVTNTFHIYIKCRIAQIAWSFMNDLTYKLFKIKRTIDPSLIFLQSDFAAPVHIRHVVITLDATLLHFLHKAHFSLEIKSNYEIENLFYKCLIRCVFANKHNPKYFQLWQHVFDHIEAKLSRRFRVQF